jgi:hypothetical protein
VGYSFAKTNKDNIVLVHDDIIVAKVEDIPGFELIRIDVVDTAINNISSQLPNTTTQPDTSVIQRDRRQSSNDTVSLYLFEFIFGGVFIITWLAGIVLAKGVYDTLYALFPPYAWYLFIEAFMKYVHFIPS